MKHFICKKEDFICKKCKTKVKGNGYTNHCPYCLWSRHVDKELPGDRASECLGLMEPIGIDLKNGKYSIFHRCVKCGKLSKNKIEENDNFEAVLRLVKKD